MDNDGLTMDVRRIRSKWSAQLISHGMVLDQMSCELKCDIGWICRELLRWQSKLGNTSRWVTSAREKQSKSTGPFGKVWYKTEQPSNK